MPLRTLFKEKSTLGEMYASTEAYTCSALVIGCETALALVAFILHA